MKKAIALVIAFSFIAAVVGASFARTIEEEKSAVREYLKVIDSKIALAKTANDTQKLALLRSQKKATLTRWEKIKSATGVEAEKAVPGAAETLAKPAATAPGAAGEIGLSLGGKLGMYAGAAGIIGNLDYSIANLIPGAKVRVTADYLSGTSAGTAYKVVDLGVGAIYALDMLKSAALPIDWYVGGSVLVPVKVSGGSSGSYGLGAVIGGTYLIPNFGTIAGELGYAALKGLGAKGIVASIGYGYAF